MVIVLPVGSARVVSQTRQVIVVLALVNTRCSLLHSSHVSVVNDCVMSISSYYEVSRSVFNGLVVRCGCDSISL